MNIKKNNMDLCADKDTDQDMGMEMDTDIQQT